MKKASFLGIICFVFLLLVAAGERKYILVSLTMNEASRQEQAKYTTVVVIFWYQDTNGIRKSTRQTTPYVDGQDVYHFNRSFTPTGERLTEVHVLVLDHVIPQNDEIRPEWKMLEGSVRNVPLTEEPIRVELLGAIQTERIETGESLADWFRRSDTNGDGTVEQGEIQAYVVERVADLLPIIDRNGDKAFQKDEFMPWFHRFLFELRDANHDGRLSFGEFISLYPAATGAKDVAYTVLLASDWGLGPFPGVRQLYVGPNHALFSSRGDSVAFFPSTGFMDMESYVTTFTQQPYATIADVIFVSFNGDNNASCNSAHLMLGLDMIFEQLFLFADENRDGALQAKEIEALAKPKSVLKIDGIPYTGGYDTTAQWPSTLTYEHLEIPENTRLVFTRDTTIFVKELTVGRNVRIVCQGRPGNSENSDGGDAPNITFYAVFGRETNDLVIESHGGNGMPGRKGNNGESGAFEGTSGEGGGNGGNAGSPGVIHVNCAFLGPKHTITCRLIPGTPGAGGTGGEGGGPTVISGAQEPNGERGNSGKDAERSGLQEIHIDEDPNELLHRFGY